MAQKLPGVSLPPRPGKQNEWFRDLVDLVLMEALIAHDYAALGEACELVFGSRSTHAWPPDLDAMPSHWAEPFAQLAGELELPQTDIEPALIRGRTPAFGSIYRPGEQGLNLDSGRPESLRTTTHCGRANAADRPPDSRRALDRPFQFQYIGEDDKQDYRNPGAHYKGRQAALERRRRHCRCRCRRCRDRHASSGRIACGRERLAGGLFDHVAGSMPGLRRASQGDFEERLPIE